jgi:hypothetical protein
VNLSVSRLIAIGTPSEEGGTTALAKKTFITRGVKVYGILILQKII